MLRVGHCRSISIRMMPFQIVTVYLNAKPGGITQI
jgi:hypothetical protein